MLTIQRIGFFDRSRIAASILSRCRRGAGVDDEHAFVPGADDDVGAAAGQHVHVAGDVNRLDRTVRRDLLDAAVDVDELFLREQRRAEQRPGRAMTRRPAFTSPPPSSCAASHDIPDTSSPRRPAPLPAATRLDSAKYLRNGFLPGRKFGTSCACQPRHLFRGLAVVEPVGVATVHHDEFFRVDHRLA